MTLQAVIFDMDGVVTDTAKVHCIAWKTMFDRFLQHRAKKHDQDFVAFTDQDYLQFVDGKPRLDGIRDFLASREITIPLGETNDPADTETAYGLGNNKNTLFNDILAQDGVDVFASTIALIKALHQQQKKVAIVSSSKNCAAIIKRAGIQALFQIRVDGVVLTERGLAGKPNPAMFLEAAQELGVNPRDAVVVEDAISGVQAGRSGGFGLVIGIDRTKTLGDQLKEQGADIVVHDLDQLSLEDLENSIRGGIPSALDHFERISTRLAGKRPAIFLDYDGTLTPIVARPDLATLSDSMRTCLRKVAQHFTTAIVSGRQLADVQQLVNLDDLYFAGNHGFEIEGPHHTQISDRIGEDFLTLIDAAHTALAAKLEAIEGLLIEHKKFSLSVHFRQVDPARVGEIEAIVDEVLSEQPRLRKHFGKKVFEIRPRMDWHKGKAVAHLLTVLALDKPNIVPIYIGDDVTDEDAFKALKGKGLGILVAAQPQQTAADFVLKDTHAVQVFLTKLSAL